MKAAIYCRVSTLEQAEQGYSLTAQQEKLEAYANGMGYSIFNVYVDDGFSGKNLQRPAMLKLIDDVKLKKVDIVLIYKLDRLSRKVKDVLELVELFEIYNVALFSLNENLDLSSPFGRAALKMSATFSELERETIVERMRMGKAQRAKQGSAMNHNMLPIGYDYDEKNKKFVPNQVEKEQVIKIYELYLQGLSIAQVSKYMHEHYVNRYGSYADRTSVAKVLSNPFCAGYFVYAGEIYRANNIEPIIDYETWIRAEAKRLKNKKALRRVSSPYLLTGLVRCGVCDRPYCAKKYNNEYTVKNGEKKQYLHFSYGCSARVKFDKKYYDKKCDNVLIEMDELNNYVTTAVKKLKFKQIKTATKRNSPIAEVEKDIENLNKENEKIINLYLKNLINQDKLESLISKNNAEIEKLTKSIERLKEDARKEDVELDVKEINDMIKNFDNLSHEEKRMLLRILIDSVVVYPDEIKINFKA